MKKFISIATILFQLFIAFVALFTIYLIFALLDMDDFDLPNAVEFLLFQPIFGFIICGLTIVACFIIGLPIRLISNLNNWWTKKPFIVFSALGLGMIFLTVSIFFTHPVRFVNDGQEITKQVPNTILVTTGWFLTACCLLHFYPMSIINWVKKKISPKQF